MQTIIQYKGKKYLTDLSSGYDISIPLYSGHDNPNAFFLPEPQFIPFAEGDFIGSVSKGGPVNCENIFFNAHGNGTHTECIGHITPERITINSSLKNFFFVSRLISVPLFDHMITKKAVESIIGQHFPEALIIRTLPNTNDKQRRKYSGNNPAYCEPELCWWLAQNQVQHLLIDLPSVDPEQDEGALTAHKFFWQYPQQPRLNATITEMIFVPESVIDGSYLLNLQIASFESDASPSKPVLYQLQVQ
jgi:kynurenine formamidase